MDGWMFLSVMLASAAYWHLAKAGKCSELDIVDRAGWNATPAKAVVKLKLPLKLVVIHHTYMKRCTTGAECRAEVKAVQNFHMVSRGWDDIGYNWIIGEDGRAYEGRGWNNQGAHAKHWNQVSFGISVMGDFTSRVPNAKALKAIHDLIDCAILKDKLTPALYTIHGHRDVGNTECPGEAFYRYISHWSHFTGPITTKRPPPIHHTTATTMTTTTTTKTMTPLVTYQIAENAEGDAKTLMSSAVVISLCLLLVSGLCRDSCA